VLVRCTTASTNAHAAGPSIRGCTGPPTRRKSGPPGGALQPITVASVSASDCCGRRPSGVLPKFRCQFITPKEAHDKAARRQPGLWRLAREVVAITLYIRPLRDSQQFLRLYARNCGQSITAGVSVRRLRGGAIAGYVDSPQLGSKRALGTVRVWLQQDIGRFFRKGLAPIRNY